MAQEHAAQVGSGTIPFVRNILPSGERGVNNVAASGQGGVRIGTQVILANPEDLNSVDAFAVNEHTVGSGGGTEIIGPLISPLTRNRTVRIQNSHASTDIYVGHNSSVTSSTGFLVAAGTTLELPLLHNVSVWAISALGNVSVRTLIY